MSDSIFDADAFLNSAVNSAFATQPKLCPVGEYEATVEKLQVDSLPSGSIALKVSWNPEGWDGFPVRQTIFLDLDENGKLDTSEGANYQLGRLLEAVGQLNKKGWKIGDLIGARAHIAVEHTQSKKDAAVFYDGVSRVTAL
jgi:hypothetical protein